jgi:hypothetical protein
MSAVNNQVITCPKIDPTSKQTPNFLLQVWAGNGGKGVMNDSLPVDTKTGLISSSAIAGQVQSLINTGVIPVPPMNESGTVNMDGLMQQDGQLYSNLQSEFCWYESRYIYALNQFLQSATLRQATDATQANEYLAITQQLNKRANSVLQIISYLAQTRVGNILSSKTAIDGLNVDINNKLAKLQAGYSLLNKDNAIVMTQKEMVRFTEEKNNYTNNRIIVWSALNVLALGAIFYVYQNA